MLVKTKFCPSSCFFNSHLYQRNLAVVGAQNRISQVVVVVGFFLLLDMSRSPDLLEPHSGSCRGKGLLTRAYHGYARDDDDSALLRYTATVAVSNAPHVQHGPGPTSFEPNERRCYQSKRHHLSKHLLQNEV